MSTNSIWRRAAIFAIAICCAAEASFGAEAARKECLLDEDTKIELLLSAVESLKHEQAVLFLREKLNKASQAQRKSARAFVAFVGEDSLQYNVVLEPYPTVALPTWLTGLLDGIESGPLNWSRRRKFNHC